MSGNVTVNLEELKEGLWYLPPNTQVILTPYFVPVSLPGVNFIQARFRNENGQMEEWDYAQPIDESGNFNLPRSWASGKKGEFVLYYGGGKGDEPARQVVIDIETSQIVPPKPVVGSVGSHGDGIWYFTDTDRIVINPHSVNGIGDHILGEARYNSPKVGVQIYAVTWEKEIARGVIIINVHTGEETYRPIPMGSNNVIWDFPAGTFHIIPDWPRLMDRWTLEHQNHDGGKG